MTEVNRSSGTSSTELLQRAMEESHSVRPGDGKELAWHADHRTLAEANLEKRKIPDPIEKLTEYVTEKAGKEIGKYVGKAAYSGGATAATVAVQKLGGAALGGPGLIIGGAIVPSALWAASCLKAEDLTSAGNQDAFDIAVTSVCDFDPAFKETQFARHGRDTASLLSHLLYTDEGKAEVPQLQAIADEGSRAAFDALRCGGPTEYFRLHPDAAKRFDEDVAFNKGFEYVTWSASQPDGEARMTAIRARVDARDARASVPVPVHG